MEDFEYVRPDTIGDACSALQRYDDAEVLSGGQSLLPMLRQRIVSPNYVVDISRIEDADYVRLDDGEIAIGHLARYVDIEKSTLVHKECRVVSDVVSSIGDRQVRNHGTFCGSIAHADPSGDPPVIVTALEADIVATGPDGETTYDPESFYHGFYETELDEDELVTEVRIPVLSDSEGAAYEKYEPSEGAYPTATVAAVVETNSDTVTDARIVVGALEPQPTRMTTAEERLIGGVPTEDRLVEAAETVGEDVDPMEDSEGSVEFKSELIKSLTKDAVELALERAGGTPAFPE